METLNHSNFLCKKYILNGLDNTIYNVYSSINTTKELSEFLRKKYNIENTSLKNFIVTRV